MNAYFFKMNKAEKNDILDQHKKIYDGFVTSYGQQINQQPLYTQDYANDKEGLTVSNKGVVKSYTNMNINESDAFTGAKYLHDTDLYTGTPSTGAETDVNYVSFDGKDRIGDSKTDMEHGTFDEPEIEYDLEIDFDPEEVGSDFDPISVLGFEGEIEDESVEPLQEQLNKTLNMFRRFKNY